MAFMLIPYKPEEVLIFCMRMIFKTAGKAEGFLYEDDGDGYEFSKGGYLLTTYVVEQQSSVVTLKVLKSEGSWKRPNRRLHVKLLLGKGAVVCCCFMKF